MAKVLSIEVGSYLTKVCEMDFRSKTPKVYKYFSLPTPDGVYDDGFITPDPTFCNEIKDMLAANKIKTKQVVCSITSSKIATREVLIPSVKTSQVGALIEANASDYFPIDLSEYEIGHLILGYSKDTDGSQKLKCMVMACGKQLIESYERLATACGLHLISVDYSGNSIYQIMRNEVKENTEMVIRVDERSTIASIISNQSLVMQRTFAYGVENAIMTMAGNPAFPQKSFTEALDEMKRITCIKLALSENTVMIEKEDEVEVSAKVAAAMKEITEALAPVIGNIARVLDLYNSKNPDAPVKRVVLIGMGSDISGLSKLFTNELQVKTVIAENINGISWNHAAGVGTSGRYVTAIGAGIAPIGFINEEKKTSDLKDVNYKNVSLLIIILCLIVSGALFMSAWTPYNAQKKRSTSLDNLKAQYEPAVDVYNQYNNVFAMYNEVKSAYELTEVPNDNLLNFLKDLEKNLPEDCEVTMFTSNVQFANITLRVANMEVAGKTIDTIRSFESAALVTVGQFTEEVEEELEEAVGEDDKKAKSDDKKKDDKKNDDAKEGEEEESENENPDSKISFTLHVVYPLCPAAAAENAQ